VKTFNRGMLVLMVLGAGACVQDNADSRAAHATEQRMQEAASQVGMPKIVNFTELKFATMISELRDQSIKTWTYVVDLNGQRHLLCESVGYGLPYGVQITNPEKIDRSSTAGYATLPQAEPNGLFMPDNAAATWVLCSDGKGGVAPVYSEPELLVSPFPLGHVDAASNSGFADTVSLQRLPDSTRVR
jgi:hypothetical protein